MENRNASHWLAAVTRLTPLPKDGGVKNVPFLFLFHGSELFFLSIITFPGDWVTVVQSAGKGSGYYICWIERWEKKRLIIECFSHCSLSLVLDDSMRTTPFHPLFFHPMVLYAPPSSIHSNPSIASSVQAGFTGPFCLYFIKVPACLFDCFWLYVKWKEKDS